MLNIHLRMAPEQLLLILASLDRFKAKGTMLPMTPWMPVVLDRVSFQKNFRLDWLYMMYSMCGTARESKFKVEVSRRMSFVWANVKAIRSWVTIVVHLPFFIFFSNDFHFSATSSSDLTDANSSFISVMLIVPL